MFDLVQIEFVLNCKEDKQLLLIREILVLASKMHENHSCFLTEDRIRNYYVNTKMVVN